MTTTNAGATIWFTGLPSSGKSTLAARLAARLPGPVQVLDGDVLRADFFPELGFSQADRTENVRRTGRLALMLARHGVTVLVPVIAPYSDARAWVRGIHADAGIRYAEVWVDAPLEVCMERDIKGLYAKARSGQLVGMTGLDDPYEPPDPADLHLRTDLTPVEDCLNILRGFAPERIDPGNRLFGLANTPKVVGGYTSVCARRATELYRGVVPEVHVAKGLREAEAAKILENTYRQVNLALVHEFAEYCEVQGIDVMSVIEAAATKPFGYQPFYPGVGVGGHCIPVDPLYLAASARAQGTPMRLVETAQQINDHRPVRIAEQCRRWLTTSGIPAQGARVLVLGVTYKPDVADVRNTPVVGIVRGLRALGVEVSVHDPLVDGLDVDGDRLAVVTDLDSAIAAADLVLVAQRHSAYTSRLLRQAGLVLHAGHRR